jgi:hypothetical protein
MGFLDQSIGKNFLTAFILAGIMVLAGRQIGTGDIESECE